MKVLKRGTIVFPRAPPWWESQQDMMSRSLWAQKSPAASPTRLPRGFLSADHPTTPPPPLLNDWTLRAQPLWCKTSHCRSSLTARSVITWSMSRPGAIITVWSGLENVFWTTNKVSPTTIPLPPKFRQLDSPSRSPRWSRRTASQWFNVYILLSFSPVWSAHDKHPSWKIAF